MLIEAMGSVISLLKPKELSEAEKEVSITTNNLKLSQSSMKEMRLMTSNVPFMQKVREKVDNDSDALATAKNKKIKWEGRFEFRKKLLSAIVDVSILGPAFVAIVRLSGY